MIDGCTNVRWRGMSRRPERRARRPLPRVVEAVQERIELWRRAREKRTRMPEDLWEAAAAVAAEHGLWFVSRALRVNYESLKRRVGSVPEEEHGRGGASFVEVPAGSFVGQGVSPTTVLELSSGDGAKLTMRFDGHDALDVPALAAAFWQRDR